MSRKSRFSDCLCDQHGNSTAFSNQKVAHLPIEDPKNDQKDWWKAVGRDLVRCTSGTSALRGVGNSNKHEM